MATINMSHKTVMPRCHSSNLSFPRTLFEPVKRKDDIHVFVSVSVIIVIMRDTEARWRCSPWDHTVARITRLIFHIEWFVRFQVHSGSGHKGYSTN